jgi:phosphate transport system protein
MGQHLQHELELLRRKLLTLFTMSNDMIVKSVRAFEKSDMVYADEVINDDHRVDMREVEIEEDGLKILALHQPVAIDLRFIVGVLKVTNDLERVADLAVNIAERAKYLAGCPSVEAPFRFDLMARKTMAMMDDATKCLMELDTVLAKKIIASDTEIDQINREMYQLFFESVRSDPQNVAAYLQYLAVSRHLERIADYATNIAEDVIYMVEGTIVRHDHKMVRR